MNILDCICFHRGRVHLIPLNELPPPPIKTAHFIPHTGPKRTNSQGVTVSTFHFIKTCGIEQKSNTVLERPLLMRKLCLCLQDVNVNEGEVKVDVFQGTVMRSVLISI